MISAQSASLDPVFTLTCVLAELLEKAFAIQNEFVMRLVGDEWVIVLHSKTYELQ